MKTPIWIGEQATLSFGWFHAATGTQRACGVVLCSPLGYESMCTHRTYRVLAETLAEAGFPVVRFDYHGAGDSAGQDTDASRVTAWKHGIAEAIDALKRHSGCERVVLFGLRAGATLALSVAADRTDVEAAIAWAPFLSGKAYVRELRAFNLIKGATSGAAQGLEAAGFMLTQETLDALTQLDLTKLSVAPAPRLLVLQRDAASNEDKLATHLRTLGSDVTLELVAGYEEMMRDPHDAVVPSAVIAHVAAWLAARVEVRGIGEHAAPPSPEDQRVDDVTERSMTFGDGGRLFGIVTRAACWERERPAIIVLNTGSNHHVGSNRLSVALTREWARRGFICLRFDITGLGDSVLEGEMRGERLYDPRTVGDVQAAIAMLEASFGVRSFVLAGLCSGAYLAFHAAMLTPSVVGHVMMNPQPIYFAFDEGMAQPTTRFAFKSNRHYRELLLTPSTYGRLLRGDINVRGIASVLAQRAAARLKRRLVPAKEDAKLGPVAAGALAIADRGADTLVIFSSDDSGYDQLRELLGDHMKTLEARDNYNISVVADADHTFTRLADRAKLIELVVSHVSGRFSGSPVSRSTAAM